jgi:ElaB/YqjD/DUF883 family membrane-anchored ribosome-binding protein
MSQMNDPTNEDRYTTTTDEPRREVSASGNGGTAKAAAQQASEVASTGVESVKQVASDAAEQVKDVAAQAKSQVSDLIGQTRQEVRQQAEAKGQEAASSLRKFSEQITALSQGRPSEAGQLTSYLDDARQRVQGIADTLEQRGPQGLLDDVTQFARRKPGTFLLCAAVAGFGVGRLVRAGAASDSTAGSASPATYGSGVQAPRASLSRSPVGELGSSDAPSGEWPDSSRQYRVGDLQSSV